MFVDHGLLRRGEAEQVEQDFVAATGVAQHVVEASSTFLDALAGVGDPETSAKTNGRDFIRVGDRGSSDRPRSALGPPCDHHA